MRGDFPQPVALTDLATRFGQQTAIRQARERAALALNCIIENKGVKQIMWNFSRLQDLLDCTDPGAELDVDDDAEYEFYGGNYYTIELFGNDLQQTWKNMEQGAPLFWLAAVVGIEAERMIDLACELIEEVFQQGENVSWEQGQCLAAVNAWIEAEQAMSLEERTNWHVGGEPLFQILRFATPFPPEERELAEVASCLAYLIRARPAQQKRADEHASLWTLGKFATCAADLGDQLTHTLTTFQKLYQNSEQPLYEVNRGWEANRGWTLLGKEAASQLADFIRQRIQFADLLAAAQRTGIWSVSDIS